jgi:hypothetical protein
MTMPTAFLSVSNKKGLVELAHELASWAGTAGSGGTAAAIREAGLPFRILPTYTGSPEILGGRVKTLHPAVHGGILARDTRQTRATCRRIHARLIDLVVVNLYPFQETISKAGRQPGRCHREYRYRRRGPDPRGSQELRAGGGCDRPGDYPASAGRTQNRAGRFHWKCASGWR